MTDYFVPRNILYIPDYQFDDGTQKSKLLIILDRIE